MTNERTARIGLVSVSDRASGGVYQDQGIPALTDWLKAALTSPFELESRLIADERPAIEAALTELVDRQRTGTQVLGQSVLLHRHEDIRIGYHRPNPVQLGSGVFCNIGKLGVDDGGTAKADDSTHAAVD